MDNYFKVANDLDSNVENKDTFFHKPEELGNTVEKADTSFHKPDGIDSKTDGNYFSAPGNIEEGKYFHKPEELGNIAINENEINDYINSVVSGEKTYGPVLGGAKMFVTFDKLKEMVNEGYNIIRANYFKKPNVIEVEFDIPSKSKTR